MMFSTNISNNAKPTHLLATVSDLYIDLWKFGSGFTTLVKHASLQPHKKTINCVQWNHNNQVLVSCSDDGAISLIHASGKSLGYLPIQSFENEKEEIKSLSFSPGSRYIAYGGTHQVVKIWDLKKKALLKYCKGHSSTINSVCFCDEQHLASASANGDILVHAVNQNIIVNQFKCKSGVQSIQYSILKKHYLASGEDNGCVFVWDTNAGKQYASFTTKHDAPCTSVHFSPVNHLLLASAGLDKKLNFYDIGEKKPVKGIETDAPLQSLTFLEDGATVAVGTTNGQVLIYDLRLPSKAYSVVDIHPGKPVNFLTFQAFNNRVINGRYSVVPPPEKKEMTSSVKKSEVNLGNIQNVSTNIRKEFNIDLQMKTPQTQMKTSSVPVIPPSQDGMDLFSPIKSDALKESIPKPDFTFLEKKTTEINQQSFKPLAEDSGIFSPVDKVKNIEMKSNEAPKSDLKFEPFKFPNLTFDFDPYKKLEATLNEKNKQSTQMNEPKTSINFDIKQTLPQTSFDIKPTINQINLEAKSTLPETSKVSQTNFEKPNEIMKKFDLKLFETKKIPEDKKKEEEKKGSTFTISDKYKSSLDGISLPKSQVEQPKEVSKESLKKNDLMESNSFMKTMRTMDTQRYSLDSKQFHFSKDTSKQFNEMSDFTKRSPERKQSEKDSMDYKFFMEFIKNALDDKLNSFRQSIHEDVQNMHLDMLKQFQYQEEAINEMIQSRIEPLIEEIKALREENKMLKQYL